MSTQIRAATIAAIVAAQALLGLLTSPAAIALFKSHGFEPARR